MDRDEEEVEERLKENVLAVVWAAGKLGAAYYEIETSELYLLPDIAESAPEFGILSILFHQVAPKYVLVSARQDERLLVALRELCGHNLVENKNPGDDNENNPNNTQTTQQHGETPQLFVQAGREFAPDTCKQRVLSLRIASEPKNHDAREHLIFINSLIPFSNEIMIRATGALLKFLDKSGIELLQLDLVDGQPPVLNVSICTMDDLVLVDHTAWGGLQLFSVDFHPAGAKQGKSVATKEGLSIFGHLNNCSSAQGSKFLRLQLLQPTRDITVLNRRFDVVEYCADPANTDFVQGAFNCLKFIKSIPKLLFKISTLHASMKEWKDLYQTIYHCLLLGELCSTRPAIIYLFQEISKICKSDTLRELSHEMMRVINFEESIQRNRFVAKAGIDPELDKKKEQYACLPDVMSMIAAEEMGSLPDFVNQCSVVYIPEVGYLLSVTLWGENLQPEDLEIPGLEYKFTNQQLGYYKSARMKELDIILGDCLVAILDRETSIMIHLGEYILKHSSFLRKIGILASELDSLNAIGSVARNNNYVRPTIVPGHHRMEIIDGRHPLVEILNDFVPNSTLFSSNERIQILTGPNASGKSIYLKQVGIIVILALSGCFVPAVSAIIPAFDRVCTRIHAQESVSTGLSTFMVDINQMSLALRTGNKNSLIIVDEFGKGTAEADGIALLIATIQDFIMRGPNCPTIFLSTHYYSLMEYLSEDYGFVKYQTMEFMEEKDRIIYLFKLKNGSCKSSFAHLVAQESGIPDSTIQRAKEIGPLVHNQLRENKITALPSEDTEKQDLIISVAEEFLNLDLDSVDPLEYLEKIHNLFLKFPGEDDDPL